MYPPTADQPPRGLPAALLNDPETAEEVREALAIARREARALFAGLARLASERTLLAAALAECQAIIEAHLRSHPHAGETGPHSLSVAAAHLRLLRQTLLQPPELEDAA